jgi:hypothetical protein
MKKLTILIAAVALVCFAAPAMAVDWNFYGNARMATYYRSDDGGDVADDDAELQWSLQGNSRFGATIKAENINARIEMGINESTVSSRRVYGVWNFGAGKMKVGKDYTPVSQFISGQVFDGDLGLLGVGTQYGSRRGQISFAFGNFEVALIDPQTGGAAETFVVAGATFEVDFTGDDGDVDKIIPKLEASYGMSFDTWNFGVQGGLNYFEVNNIDSPLTGKSEDVDVTSWTLGADAGFNFGPGYVKGAISLGENWGNANWAIPGNFNQGAFATYDGDDDTDDVEVIQGALVAGLKVSDMLSFEGGVGFRQDDPDEGDKSKPWAAYVQSVISLAPGVYIIPEIGYFDQDVNYDDDDETSTFYVGGKWQINF